MNIEARVPENGASDWESMDIFVFSNGQQYSPPRKYHLSNEELSWWNATLNFLARSQYGSTNSMIDLYTIDGHKVEGPVNLGNGGAYVAVKPSEPFIESGYDKYLIKASRSWEKRQARKSSSIEVTLPENMFVQAKKSKPDINIEDSDTKAPVNTTTMETVFANIFEDQASMNVRPQVQGNTEQNSRRNTPTTTKQADKKTPTTTQRTSILRRNINSITSPPTARKTSLKTNNSPPKRISNVPVKTNDKAPSVSSNNKIAVIPRTVDKTLNTVKGNVLKLVSIPSKVKEISAEMATSSVTKVSISNHKSSITENAQIENVIDDKDIILVSNIFRNSQRDIPSSILDVDGNPVMSQKPQNKPPSIIEKSQESKLDIEPGVGPTKHHKLGRLHLIEDTIANIPVPNTSSQIKVINAPKSQPTNNVIISNESGRDHYLSFIHKGDVVNLKLQIEVRNGDGTVCSFCAPRKTSQRSHSYINVETEKEFLSVDDEMIVQSKSLQSIIAKEYSQSVGSEGNYKIVVIKCACCDHYSDFPASLGQENNKKYIILRPTLRCEENIRRCQCKPEITNENEKEAKQQDEPHIKSIVYPIKKIISTTSLEVFNKTEHESEFVLTGKEKEMPMSKVNSNVSQSEESQRKEYVVTEHNVMTTAKEDSKTEYVIAKSPTQASDETKKINFFVVRKNSTAALPKDVMDKFTQTEWCSIMLEARLHEDGHCTFHLPPLHVLRYYKL